MNDLIDGVYQFLNGWRRGGRVQQARWRGADDGRFGPEDSMTVEQAMVIIYRFFGSPAVDLSILAEIEGSARISPWARNAAAWAMACGIFKPAKTISPQDPITMEKLTYSISQIVAAT